MRPDYRCRRRTLSGKRLELLREVVPNMRRLAILGNVDYAASVLEMNEVQAVAGRLGVDVVRLGIHRAADIVPAFDDLRSRAEAKAAGFVAVSVESIAPRVYAPLVAFAKDRLRAPEIRRRMDTLVRWNWKLSLGPMAKMELDYIIAVAVKPWTTLRVGLCGPLARRCLPVAPTAAGMAGPTSRIHAPQIAGALWLLPRRGGLPSHANTGRGQTQAPRTPCCQRIAIWACPALIQPSPPARLVAEPLRVAGAAQKHPRPSMPLEFRGEKRWVSKRKFYEIMDKAVAEGRATLLPTCAVHILSWVQREPEMKTGLLGKMSPLRIIRGLSRGPRV